MTRLICILIVLGCALWARASAQIRLAVVDFQPSGAVGEYDTLGAGLQSMLTTDLSAVSTLTVVERAQLAALQRELKLSRSALADPKTALRIGKLAGASHLLTGSFTLVGDKMRLDARVIDVATAKVQFATKIEGEKDAFFELEKDLAAKVIESVGARPSAKERSVLGRVHTADLAAFQSFSQGLILFDEAQYERAFEALKEATKRDEEFKLARSTLQEYERLSEEIRAKAQLLDAQRASDAARVRIEELSATQQIQQRLLAVADRASTPRRDRAAALCLLAAMEDVTDDYFANQRMREMYITRYMLEFSPLFPQFAISPLRPFGERFGNPDLPENADQVPKAVAAASAAVTFQSPGTHAELISEMRSESVSTNFSTIFPELIENLPLDFKGQTHALQRLYELGAKHVPGPWRADALRRIALRKRGTLEVTESTRMLREAAVLGNDSGAVRALAWEVDANAEIARALEQAGSNTCLREALMITLARGNSPSSNPRKGQDPCASRDLIIARMIHNQHEPFFIGETRAWLWKGESSVLWSGPRSDALRSNELRYLGGPKSTDSHELRGPWSVAMLEGIPRMQAEVQFSLSYERTVDAAAAIEVMPGDKPAGNEVPNVSVFFAARNVQARSHGPARDRTAIPMRAQGITIRSGRVALADVEADLYGSNPETLRITPKAAQAVELPRTGQIAIRVARDAGGTTVEVAGKKLRFDTGAAAPGFIGIAMEGPGFVRVGQPKIAALK